MNKGQSICWILVGVLALLGQHLLAAGPLGSLTHWLLLLLLGWSVWRLICLAAYAPSRAPQARSAATRPSLLVQDAILAVLPALLFICWGLYLWQTLVVGLGVPVVILPAPTHIATTFIARLDTLGQDFVQTYIRSAVPGYIIGCGSAFTVAVMAWRFPVLGRGLLPLGNFMAVMPIVGLAPIMVMWFGFDWQSKAAVAALMTFFPMLVNCLAGFAGPGRQERDLMRSYAAKRWTCFAKLVLPSSMPFILNGLKLCSTLALIGAVVAEFFGTPIVGLGFRISSEVGRLSMDVVWAAIIVAALAGTASFGVLVMIERQVTFWHPSQRKRAAR